MAHFRSLIPFLLLVSLPATPARAETASGCVRARLSRRASLPTGDRPGSGIATRCLRIAENGVAPGELAAIEQEARKWDGILRTREEWEDRIFFGTLHPQQVYLRNLETEIARLPPGSADAEPLRRELEVARKKYRAAEDSFVAYRAESDDARIRYERAMQEKVLADWHAQGAIRNPVVMSADEMNRISGFANAPFTRDVPVTRVEIDKPVELCRGYGEGQRAFGSFLFPCTDGTYMSFFSIRKRLATPDMNTFDHFIRVRLHPGDVVYVGGTAPQRKIGRVIGGIEEYGQAGDGGAIQIFRPGEKFADSGPGRKPIEFNNGFMGESDVIRRVPGITGPDPRLREMQVKFRLVATGKSPLKEVEDEYAGFKLRLARELGDRKARMQELRAAPYPVTGDGVKDLRARTQRQLEVESRAREIDEIERDLKRLEEDFRQLKAR